MFRFRAKALLAPIEARHMTHWANADWDDKTHNAATANADTTQRMIDLFVSLMPTILAGLSRRLRRRWRTQFTGAKTVREKDQQHKADADDQGRHNRQNQVQA